MQCFWLPVLLSDVLFCLAHAQEWTLQHAGSINKNLALLVCKKTSRYRKVKKKKAAPTIHDI